MKHACICIVQGAPWKHCAVRSRVYEWCAWAFCSKTVPELTAAEASDMEATVVLMEQA